MRPDSEAATEEDKETNDDVGFELTRSQKKRKMKLMRKEVAKKVRENVREQLNTGDYKLPAMRRENRTSTRTALPTQGAMGTENDADFAAVVKKVNSTIIRNERLRFEIFGGVEAKEGEFPFLVQVDLFVVDREECDKAHVIYPVTTDMICCAGPAGETPCKGDSGGPLVLKHQPDVVVGLVSWGIRCNELPSVYANVHFLVDWINENKVD
ncbi:unnamed protein product [Cyprideis torosa]|uniref:Uncharacterized protein n=1 Tax=Cyprideis torosa TaxID=163714 RepID=A0A7R8WF75_9CRUS|nr:unnamed protein product [Cyprideis torosa]CAG0896647.1 unnamed protein product [Cyprideis torosa]